jgi:hypothetical protein
VARHVKACSREWRAARCRLPWMYGGRFKHLVQLRGVHGFIIW